LSKLERDIHDTLDLELKTWKVPNETTLRSGKWRSLDRRKRRRTEAGESVNESNEGRGGGNNGLPEADGSDGDQYMEIIKWRNEVINIALLP
jgi:hypothetical protein